MNENKEFDELCDELQAHLCISKVELAERLNLDPKTLRAYRREGLIPKMVWFRAWNLLSGDPIESYERTFVELCKSISKAIISGVKKC